MYVVPAPPVPPTTWGAITKRPRLWWTLWLAGTGTAAGTADERVAAHVEVSAPGAQSFNALVHFVGEPADLASLAALAEGVRAADRPDAGLLVMVVLREGLLGRGGGEITVPLEAFVERLNVPPIITEDAQGGWSAALGVSGAGRGPVTRLVDAEGVAAWAHEGPIEAAALAAVLRERLTACPPPAAEPVRLAVRSGDPAPGFFVETAAGQWTEIQALRGRPVILAFVQTWARPCVAQLRRLQRLQEQNERTGTMTVAIVDGLGAEEARAFARRHGLTFPVSGDADGEIRRRYGIRVWPTTVLVDDRGRIAGTDMGTDAGALAALAREPEWAAQRPPVVTRT
jgi:peroxiredoxin